MKARKQKNTAGTLEILGKNERAGKHDVDVLGKKYVVYPNVFSPKYFHDTTFFAQELPDLTDESFLEIGSGTGVISCQAVLKGAKRAVAVDINPDAVANTRANAARHGLLHQISAFQGDVYEPLSPTDQFDTIFWNTPFAYLESAELSHLEKSVLDPDYQATKRFVVESKDHLKPNGRLLIGFSKTLGEYDLLQEFLTEAGFTAKVLASTQSIEKYPVSFELIEARPSK